ncbi:MAG TPA: DUF5801 repeats-in-toxin domain-containing protein, partial [Devosia sp.]|nr:DUF5801 repeats-in-toxin domain-containing protein [Devosia sp.]
MVERIGNEEGVEFGTNVEAAETILVAQADTGTPAEPAPAPTTAETRVVVELEDGAVLRLPATASVDQPRENGTDLEFVQPDGTVIVVPNGAIQGLTIFIGSAEIPPLTVAALFESNGIETAAGPAGAGAGARGSGGNFEVPVGGIGDAFAIGGLLDPTELLFGTPTLQPLYEGLIDSEPTVGANGMAMLDDDDLPGGIAGGLGDDASGPLTGILAHDYGINGVGSLVLTGVALPPGLGFASALSPDGLVLTISQNGTDVLRITLADSTSGAYTIAQLAPIHHPGAGEDNVLFELTYRVTDSDGDFIDGKMTVNVDDDTPVAGVDASIALPVLTVDESTGTGSGTDGQLSASASFAANFGASPAFGADGAGSVNYELVLDGSNIASGLFAVDPAAAAGKGAEIVLNQGIGGVVTGSVNDVDYFTISVDATGKVTFTLTGNAPVWHADTGNHDDASSLDVAADKLLLRQTITDADGDSDSASVDIGSAKIFTVEDDGPKAGIDQAIALPVLMVDESTGTGSGTDGQLSTTASFAANFGASPAFGADGAGSVNYELVLDGSNIASGLFAVDPAAAAGKGAEIVLNQGVGGVVTGSVNGVDYFTITVDATGKVTFTLTGNAPVWHANTGNHDDASSLDVAADKLLLRQTITDADGDSDSASVDIGSAKIFTVEDDGPKAGIDQAIALPVLMVDESTGTGSGTDGQLSAEASFAANFGTSPAFGADGAGSVNYELVLDGSNIASGLFAVDPAAAAGKGAEIVLNQGVGGVVTGSVNGVDYFTITVDATGKVTFTLTGNAPVWHANTGNHDDASSLDVAADKLLLRQTITDADGDSDSASVDIGSAKIFTVEDDGPRATVVTNAAFSLTHDETPFVQAGTNDATVLNAVLLAGRFAGVNPTGQDPQSLFGLPLGIAQSTVAAVSISSLDYGADGAAASNSLVYGFSLTNALGQAVPGQVDSGLKTTEGKPIYLFIENGLVVGRFDGADAATDVSSSDPAAFALHIDPQSGQVTLIQYVSLFHDDASNANDLVSLDKIDGALKATVTVTDGDGDKLTVSASIGANIHFRDDAPVGFNTTSAIMLDDEAQSLFPANPGPLFGGDVLLDFANTGGLPGSLFIAGVDGVSDIEMSTKPAFSVIYKAGGLGAQEAVTWDNGVAAPDGSVTFTAFGDVTNSAAATLTVGVDGSYVFSLFKPVVHDIGGGENDKALSFGLTVTDGDGDKAVSGLTVWVDDDTPVGRTVNNFGPLDDEAQTLFAGNNLPADLVANEKTVSGGPGALFRAGADGLASVDLITPPSLSVIYKDGPNGIPEAITDWVKTVDPVTGVTTFAAISQHYPLATPAATLVVRPDGSYSLTLNAPVVHAVSQATEESTELRFDLRVTDGDGDTDTARLTVRVNDDAPTLNSTGSVVVTVDEDGLAGANIDAGRHGEQDGGGSASFTSASGALNGLVNFGSDGMGAFSIKSVTAQDSGVNSKGADVL